MMRTMVVVTVVIAGVLMMVRVVGLGTELGREGSKEHLYHQEHKQSLLKSRREEGRSKSPKKPLFSFSDKEWKLRNVTQQ